MKKVIQSTRRLMASARAPMCGLAVGAAMSATSLLAVAAETGSTAGLDAAPNRWVSAPGVNLRSRPSLDAPVLLRMPKNTLVRLEGTDDEAYCAVSVADKDGATLSGFTACRYLAKSARPDDTPPSAVITDTRKADDERLARGTFGPAPQPYARWASLKATAVSLRPIAPGESRGPAQVAALNTLMQTLFLWSVEGAQDRPDVAVDLVRAIDLPAVAPSMFKSASEIGPPFEDAVGLSGRFHVIAVQQIRRRSTEPTESEPVRYQLVDRTQFLTRRVYKVRLFRDGTLRAEASSVRSADKLFAAPSDESTCPAFDGYQLGASDPRLMASLYGGAVEPAQLNPETPAGSLLWFYLPTAPTATRALQTSTTQSLDRAQTGFVAATTTTFDLDGDGIADLLMWEGTGHGPGHLDGPTRTDDPYQRLFFVNIQGQWSVLAADQFSYGCGC